MTVTRADARDARAVTQLVSARIAKYVIASHAIIIAAIAFIYLSQMWRYDTLRDEF